MTGTDMNHIPYRGSAPAVNDLVGGQVDLMFDNATSIIGQVRGDTVKALGVTSLKRTPLLPDLAPVSDTVPGYDTASWFGIGVRAGVSNEIIGKIEQAASDDRAGSDREGADGGGDRGSSRVRPQGLWRVHRGRAPEMGHPDQEARP